MFRGSLLPNPGPRVSDPRHQLQADLAERYAIELGRGGMATVYLAQDLKHDRRVALKLLHPELTAILGAERFLREIRLTANLQHPHILSVIDSGETAGYLRESLRHEGQHLLDEAIRLTREAADALNCARHQGFIQRDIEPENILLVHRHPKMTEAS